MIDVPRDDMVMMLEAGYLYLAMKRFKEARQVFEAVEVLAPKNDVPQVAVANVLFAQSKYLESIRILKNAIKEHPQSAHAYSYLGESLLFHGKRDEALAALKKASEVDPSGHSGDFARALINLINQGYDPVKLREAAKKAKQAEKNTAPAP